MTSKLIESKKRNHADKILHRMSKKASVNTASSSPEQTSHTEPTFSEQYEIIRSDILKLREDLNKGYDMAKNMIERKGLISQFLRAK